MENSYIESRRSTFIDEAENNEFDVEIYEYEPEEYYTHSVTPATTLSLIVKTEKPYYLPLTDVLYPGEVDSTYDLKKLV